jgi:hypothetical protein
LDAITGFFMTGNGPMCISPAAIGPDGRGAAGDGRAPFAGQAFFNPGPGALGGLHPGCGLIDVEALALRHQFRLVRPPPALVRPVLPVLRLPAAARRCKFLAR